MIDPQLHLACVTQETGNLLKKYQQNLFLEIETVTQHSPQASLWTVFQSKIMQTSSHGRQLLCKGQWLYSKVKLYLRMSYLRCWIFTCYLWPMISMTKNYKINAVIQLKGPKQHSTHNTYANIHETIKNIQWIRQLQSRSGSSLIKQDKTVNKIAVKCDFQYAHFLVLISQRLRV